MRRMSLLGCIGVGGAVCDRGRGRGEKGESGDATGPGKREKQTLDEHLSWRHWKEWRLFRGHCSNASRSLGR
jgi:hypothetical protein